MGFQAVNEIEHFSFRDCELISVEQTENSLRLELEALIVDANNSQNGNYTDSYAGTTVLRLEDASILKAYEEGHRYYDANDNLLEEVEDKPLTEAQIHKLLRDVNKSEGTYLFGMVKEQESTEDCFVYSLGIDLNETDSYWLYVSFSKSIFNWDRYMNRVQNM